MQSREAPVASAGQVRGDDVGVQLRVKRTAHAVAIGRGDEALGALDVLAAAKRSAATQSGWDAFAGS